MKSQTYASSADTQTDAAANGGGPSQLQSERLVAAVAELGSFAQLRSATHEEMSRQSIENRDPQLCRRFVEIAKTIFNRHPEIEHRWSLDADEDHCVLEIVGVGTPGYDISIEVDPDEITLFAGGFHNHYSVTDPQEDFLQEFFGRIRDMLSPAMRIREQLSNGNSYRWHLENQTEGEWHPESTCGLLFWNWFGRRSERLYMNTNLPIRDRHLDSSA